MSNSSIAHSGSIDPKSVYATVPQGTFEIDIEKRAIDDAHLRNTTVKSFAWRGITVTVKDQKTKLPKVILDNIDGVVEAGV